MFHFLQTYNLKTIRFKLISLYILNVSDALLTYLLIRTGCFIELNFLLKRAMVNIDELFLIKILLPVTLIAWLYLRIQQATVRELRLSNIAVNLVLLLYIFVNALHFMWTILLVVIEFTLI